MTAAKDEQVQPDYDLAVSLTPEDWAELEIGEPVRKHVESGLALPDSMGQVVVQVTAEGPPADRGGISCRVDVYERDGIHWLQISASLFGPFLTEDQAVDAIPSALRTMD